MINYIVMVNRIGKLRIQKWYTPISPRDKKNIISDLIEIAINNNPKACNIYTYKDLTIIHRRYAGLNFLVAIDKNDNELYYIEVVHRLVEVLDMYFGNVCELDIIYNFEKVQFVIDELIVGGELQETNKFLVSNAVATHDEMEEINPQGISFKAIFDDIGF
uniref:AP complex subunit sigma n=1 Tax=Myxobolus squamalis TaxID=59785 RepID=A0A6B2G1H3_MYXSQ